MEVKDKFPLLICGQHVVTSFHTGQYCVEVGMAINFTIEKIDKHQLNQLIKVNVNSEK